MTTTDPTAALPPAAPRPPAWRRASGHVADAAVVAVVLAVIPTLIATLVAPYWSTVLRRLVDLLTSRGVAVPSLLGLVAVWTLIPATTIGWVLSLPGLVVAAALTGRLAYPRTTRGWVRTRLAPDGWAPWWDVRDHVSASSVRRVAVVTRPSLAEATTAAGTGRTSTWRVARLPVSECGTWLGWTAVGATVGTSCYAAHRDVVGLVAPPQTGKSALLGHHIVDHPGAVVSTSTKPDLYGHTAALRARRSRSRRVELFNPEGLSGLASTFRWSPVHGCHRPGIAAERAAALVGATSAAGGEDGTFWLDSAAKVLRCFLMAAALGARPMAEVAVWVTNPTERAADALDLLEDTAHAGWVPPGWAGELRQVLYTDARRTRESIFLTLAQSVAFMADPAVAAICTPGDDAPAFDVAAFLADRGTLYVLGSERPHASVAPLLAAMTAHIFETAKRIAADLPGGRLDPPLLLALDEVALITPVPLDRWLADAGGRGVHIVWACQSPSQLAQRWGARGADTIWNATNSKVVFGGLTLDDDLDSVSALCGTRHDVVRDGDHERTERVPVLPADQLRTLPQWTALLIHRAMPATIVRVRPVWARRDVKAAGPSPVLVPIDEVALVDESTDLGRSAVSTATV